ncbi:hypothetical protein Pelo_13257 [Pelomyxa schiedti]|nr:hypothetical protein Pelo_13257 [Pelomyxa schiedti]
MGYFSITKEIQTIQEQYSRGGMSQDEYNTRMRELSRKHPLHEHPLVKFYGDGSRWACRATQLGCVCNGSTAPRWRCVQCGYDLCDECMNGSPYYVVHPLHRHPLLRNNRDNGWACDGRKRSGGCRRGMVGFNQSRGVPRFRCDTCDYDLCDKCAADFS